jgi:hypothetical protein
MNPQKFWKLIEKAKNESNGNFNSQVDYIVEKLSEASITNILKFNRLFGEYYSKIDSSAICAAAYMIENGISDDRYDYFRAWLIGQGKQIYEVALANPDDLADIEVIIQAREFSGELLMYAASYAYEEKTGEEDFDELMLDDEPAEQIQSHEYKELELDWLKDGNVLPEKLQAMLPKLYQRFIKTESDNIS